MLTDSIIEEIHKIRDEHAKKFNYNLTEIFNDLKEQEKKSGKKVVSLPVKRAVQRREKRLKTDK